MTINSPQSQTVPEQSIEKTPQQQLAASMRLAAMNLLSRREHSLHELRQKLQRRFDNIDLLESELQRLKNEKLQSDERYAESYWRQRTQRGYGPLRIAQELRQKGITEELIQYGCSHCDIDWQLLAEQVMRKKFSLSKAQDIKEKARRSRFMQYRGFSSEHFSRLLS